MLAMPTNYEPCALQTAHPLLQALVRVESAGRPFAIGMDGGRQRVSQPASLPAAISTARRLAETGQGFSVGLAQIHVRNVAAYGLSWEQAFDPCTNLALGQTILQAFHRRATAAGYRGAAAVRAALRGYNSGALDRQVSDAYATRVMAYVHGAPQRTAAAKDMPAMSVFAATEGRAALPYVRPAADLAPAAAEARDVFEKAPPRGF